MKGSNDTLFGKFSKSIAHHSGRPPVFFVAVLAVVVWALSGPAFGYSDTWQLVINTGTTIITFLMVFLIQNTQNRDSIAVQLKLDELINAVKEARNELIDVESLSEQELTEKQTEMSKLAEETKNIVENLSPDAP